MSKKLSLFNRRKNRVRSKISSVTLSGKPRLSVFRSDKHIYAQIIDDVAGKTLASASTIDVELRPSLSQGGNKEAAEHVGKLIAVRALKKGIAQVVFDRGGYLYHGRVRSLADAARDNGLEF